MGNDLNSIALHVVSRAVTEGARFKQLAHHSLRPTLSEVALNDTLVNTDDLLNEDHLGLQ